MSWFKKRRGREAGPIELPGGFAPTYGVELLFEAAPALSVPGLLEAIRTHCPAAEPLDETGAGNVLAFIHPDHPVALKDATLPAQTFVCPADRPFELTDALEADLRQSWSFPDAREAVARCRHSVLVTDLMSSPLPYRERLGLFQDALAGIVGALPASAIHWRPTGQFVDPRRFLEAYREGGAARFFAGSLNVRLYNISDEPGTMMMDTLGLAAVGLPDVQCHFRGLEPGEVAAVLANTANYLYEQGDVIEDGHTVEGIEPGSRWRCQHEDAPLPPPRVVLDLDPGPPNAAGRRQARA